MDERQSKRDLVLAPSEYAYMQDVTKGIVKTYTGPTVINPTAQERPVLFNEASKRFEPCSLEQAVQQAPIAPEGFYLILKNPSAKNDHPIAGGVYPSPDLDIGRKINITGPCAFALWPGQIVQRVQGHHLRSNQYLLVRIYNEDEARKNWGKAVIKPASAEPAAPDASATAPQSISRTPADLTVGKLLIIKGTDVSFYIPPTGVGVVPDENGQYVRDALTLERLEYCILVDQNGKKRYERGPQVVFPEPTETFIQRENHRKFRALELNEIQGLHVKVIAPYSENGRSYREGDEIFITGRETAIYFPREEHSLVRYDGKDKHFAVAVPAGEARYVMNRKTGEIRMAQGPAMLLPNPTDEIIVRRVLSDRECQTWYPGNEEALVYNRSLRSVAAAAPTTRAGVVSEGDFQRAQAPSGRQRGGAAAPVPASQAVAMDASSVSRDSNAMAGDVVERMSTYNAPRTIVFNTKYEGVPSLNVWVGYAVMVVDKKGNRRVEQGPKNLLLQYDETLEIVELSTGKPKSTEKLLRTCFLRVLNNKVSDICEVETSDHVRVKLEYSMRVNFIGEPNKWFEVENYVKFLCDHVRSVLKGAIKKHSVETFYAASVDILREVILGKAPGDDKAARAGMRFDENGMHVTDVEVLGVLIDDAKISALLNQAQHEAVESNITLLRAHRGLDVTRKQEDINRQAAEARALTFKRVAELEVDDIASKLRVVLAAIESEQKQHEDRQKAAVAKASALDVEHQAALAREKSAAGVKAEIARVDQTMRLEALRAEADAVISRFQAAQGGFSEALLALSNHDTLVKVAEAMSVQQFVGGKSLTDVIDKVFAGTPLAGLLERVKAPHAATNGGGASRPTIPPPPGKT
jgi:major vault protein